MFVSALLWHKTSRRQRWWAMVCNLTWVRWRSTSWEVFFWFSSWHGPCARFLQQKLFGPSVVCASVRHVFSKCFICRRMHFSETPGRRYMGIYWKHEFLSWKLSIVVDRQAKANERSPPGNLGWNLRLLNGSIEFVFAPIYTLHPVIQEREGAYQDLEDKSVLSFSGLTSRLIIN